MSKISLEAIKELRLRTGVGINFVKEALEATNGDTEKAVLYLREKGIAKASKRADKQTRNGIIGHYIHGNGLASLVELQSETDFAAGADKFKELAKELAMHIAAQNPEYVDIDSIPATVLEAEKSVYAKDVEGKPANVAEKILQGKLQKFYEDNVLLEQVYVRDETKKVKDLLHDAIAAIGENIKIARFVRLKLGGGVTVASATEIETEEQF